MDALDPLPSFDPLRSGELRSTDIPKAARVERMPEEPEHERDRERQEHDGEEHDRDREEQDGYDERAAEDRRSPHDFDTYSDPTPSADPERASDESDPDDGASGGHIDITV